MQVFVLKTAPPSLDEDIVRSVSFAAHTDFDTQNFNHGDPILGRELAALIGVDDFRHTV